MLVFYSREMSSLTENLRLDLERAVEGESIIWAGMQQTRFQVYAVCVLAGVLSGFFAWMGLQFIGVASKHPLLLEGISGIEGPWLLMGGIFLLASVMVVVQTRHFADVGAQVVWAITPTRLMRRIPGLDRAPPLYWPRGTITRVHRHAYKNGRTSLEVSLTPTKEGGNAKKIFISGCENMDEAEEALARLIGKA